MISRLDWRDFGWGEPNEQSGDGAGCRIGGAPAGRAARRGADHLPDAAGPRHDDHGGHRHPRQQHHRQLQQHGRPALSHRHRPVPALSRGNGQRRQLPRRAVEPALQPDLRLAQRHPARGRHLHPDRRLGRFELHLGQRRRARTAGHDPERPRRRQHDRPQPVRQPGGRQLQHHVQYGHHLQLQHRERQLHDHQRAGCVELVGLRHLGGPDRRRL